MCCMFIYWKRRWNNQWKQKLSTRSTIEFGSRLSDLSIEWMLLSIIRSRNCKLTFVTSNDPAYPSTYCISFSWMVTMNLFKNTKQQRVAHISEHLVTPSSKLTKSLVMYRIKHLNRHVLEPTVIDICKPFLKINRKHYWLFEIFVTIDGIEYLLDQWRRTGTAGEMRLGCPVRSRTRKIEI